MSIEDGKPMLRCILCRDFHLIRLEFVFLRMKMTKHTIEVKDVKQNEKFTEVLQQFSKTAVITEIDEIT